jgi:transketolase
MHTIKPIDKDIIIKAAKETRGIVTAEEHSVIGGLGSAVAEVTAANWPVKMAFVGQKDAFGESGKPDELLKKYGMTEEDIMQAVLDIQ